MAQLELAAKTGAPVKTIDNVLIILEHDERLKRRIYYDDFANRNYTQGALPWTAERQRRTWTDTDDAGLRHYLERAYGITGADRIYDATQLCALKNRQNKVQQYLTGLAWDGKKRLDTLWIDYFGAEDSAYIRATARKSIVAAVARVMEPGVKYDYMPILIGKQGTGKSTFYAY